MTQPSSLEAAHKEIDRLKSQVAELDRKLSQLQVPKHAVENGSQRQAQSAFDVLTGAMPKSRSTAALDRLNASTELLNTEQVPMATTRVVMHQVQVNMKQMLTVLLLYKVIVQLEAMQQGAYFAGELHVPQTGDWLLVD